MYFLPEKPDEFAYGIIPIINEIMPGSKVRYNGKLKMNIDGNNIDLSDLFRTVRLDPSNGYEIVADYFLKLLEFKNSESDFDLKNLLSVMPKIMPKIISQEYADSMPQDSITTIPWINGCLISLVIDFPNHITSIRKKMIKDWGLNDPEELYSFALQNLWRITEGKSFDIVDIKNENKEKVSRACIFNTNDGYDSSRILLPKLYDNISAELGKEYYVAIPSRDMFMAISAEHQPTIKKVISKIEQDYHSLPHPICLRLFLCVKDGVAAGSIDPM